jgi:hypothetical protein
VLIMKNSILNRKNIILIATSLLFLIYMSYALVILKEIEFVYLFSYVFSMDWFIYPVIALYLITIGIILLNYNIKPLIKFVISLITGIVGIVLALLLFLGIGFGFASKAYEVEGTNIILVRTQSMMDYYYDVYEIKSFVFVKPIAELNSVIYPSIIDQIESEYNGNKLIVKIINHDFTNEIHLYFDIIDDVYMLVDEIQVPKQ